MSSLLKSTLNTRALPTGDLRYVRSDAPLLLTDGEIAWLRAQRITTLVDLRSEEERRRRPCPLEKEPGFCYHHLPVTGGGDTPRSREHLHEVYRNMIDGQMERILDVIKQAQTNVLFFCTAGKDRTGVVAALLMRGLGFSDEEIIRDYMISDENLREMLTAYAAAHPQASLEIIMPRRENMERLLGWLQPGR